MRLAARMLVLGAGLCLALGSAQPSSALSLLDLANGASFDSGDGTISFSGFSAEVKGGKANKDLSTYDVIVLDDGFLIDLSNATKGKLKAGVGATEFGAFGGASVVSISEKVQIKAAGLTSVGNAFSHQSTVSTFSVVPEPTSLLLLAALALRRRR